MVYDGFTKLLSKEMKGFLYFWKLDILMLDGVYELSAFEEFLKRFEL